MFSKKSNNTILCLIGFICFILFILSILNGTYLSSNTQEYKSFKRLVKFHYSDYENELYSNKTYNLKKDEAKKILNCFINLKSNELKTLIIRLLIALKSSFIYCWFGYFISKIEYLNNNLDCINKIKPCSNIFNIFMIIVIILIFFEIIDSIVMLKYRINYLIPYMKTIISNGEEKFYHNMKACKILDILFIIILFIFLFGLILFEIQIFEKTKKYCCFKCCKENVVLYIYNANNINNINDRNPRLVEPGRNDNPVQYLIINNNQNSENNNLNPDRIENIPINNIGNRNELNRNNLNINFNNNINNRENNIENNRVNNNENNIENNRVNNNENNRVNNNEILIKKILEICNTDIFNSNKYKIDEVCSICLNNFENNDNIIILPCLHIFHDECMMDWLKKKQFVH